MSHLSGWSQFLENDQLLQDILAGRSDVPACSGKTDSLGESLASALLAGREIYSGNMPEAARILSAAPRQNRSRCMRLVRYWLQAETDDVQKVYKKLGRLMAELERYYRRYSFVLKSRLEIRDFKAARRWAPLLRLYLATLMPEWTEAIAKTAGKDLNSCRQSNINGEILVYLRYALRFARSRQQGDPEDFLRLIKSWHNKRQENPALGTGHDFYVETIINLEVAGRFDEALKWAEAGLKIQPGDFDFLLSLARLNRRTGDFRRGLASCQSLVEYFPAVSVGYCMRSNLNFLLGNYDMALHDAEKACAVGPENPEAYMARAFVFMQMSEYAKAEADFRQVLHFEPLRYEAMRGQGKCLSILGRDIESLVCFTAMRRQWPDDPDIYFELADILFSAGYLDDCARVCRRCLAIDSTYVSAYVILGMVALRRDDDETAGRLLTRAVSLEPDNPFALNELSYLKHLEGDDDTAIELVNRAIEESPDYHDALYNKGAILYYRGDFELAVQAFDQALGMDQGQASVWVGKGNSLVQLSDFDSALECYDQALAIDPENAEACQGKAVLYRMMGLEDEVRIWQERALRLDPDIEDI